MASLLDTLRQQAQNAAKGAVTLGKQVVHKVENVGQQVVHRAEDTGNHLLEALRTQHQTNQKANANANANANIPKPAPKPTPQPTTPTITKESLARAKQNKDMGILAPTSPFSLQPGKTILGNPMPSASTPTTVTPEQQAVAAKAGLNVAGGNAQGATGKQIVEAVKGIPASIGKNFSEFGRIFGNALVAPAVLNEVSNAQQRNDIVIADAQGKINIIKKKMDQERKAGTLTKAQEEKYKKQIAIHQNSIDFANQQQANSVGDITKGADWFGLNPHAGYEATTGEAVRNAIGATGGVVGTLGGVGGVGVATGAGAFQAATNAIQEGAGPVETIKRTVASLPFAYLGSKAGGLGSATGRIASQVALNTGQALTDQALSSKQGHTAQDYLTTGAVSALTSGALGALGEGARAAAPHVGEFAQQVATDERGIAKVPFLKEPTPGEGANVPKKFPIQGEKIQESVANAVPGSVSATPSAPQQQQRRALDTTIEENKRVPTTFRTDKVFPNVTPDQEMNIKNRLAALGIETRGVRSFDEMQAAAQELGADPNKLLKDANKNRITDAEVVGLRELINNNAQFISQAESRVAADPRLAAELQPKINLANEQMNAAIKKVTSGGTEAGRAVVAYKILARESLDPTFWFTRAQRELGVEKDLTPEIKGAILDLIDQKDRNGLAQFVAMLHKNTKTEKALTLWKAGLLTSPTTHFANVLGNTTSQILENASDIVSVPFDVMASLVTKKRTTTFSPTVVKEQLKASVRGAKKAGQFFRSGMYPQDLAQKWDLPREVNFENPILDKYTKSIYRSLGAEDIFFREMAMSKSFAQQASVIAKNEGLKGAQYKARVKELLTKPTNGMITEAINDAEYATFQNKTALGSAATAGKRELAKHGGEAGRAIGDFIAPFTQTPTAVAGRIVDYSPAGYVKTLIRLIKPTTRSQQNFVRDISRATTGTGIMALGALLASKGLMTGNAPTNAKERDQFYAEGKQPNSVKIAGHWYSLNKVSPMGNLLGLGANFQELSKEKSGADLYASTAFSGIKGLTDQTFLKGASGVLNAATQPDRNAATYIDQSVASFVPNIITKAGTAIDPTMRNPKGPLQAIEAKIPGLESMVPAKQDIFGKNVEQNRLALIDPFNTTKSTENDPVIQELSRIGYSIGMPSNQQAGLTLDNKQYEQYQAVNGKILKNVLDQIVASPDYQQASDTDKSDMIDEAVNEVRNQTRDAFIPKLLIEKYRLPSDVDPNTVYDVYKEIQSNDAFKKLNNKQQEKILSSVLKDVISQLKQ